MAVARALALLALAAALGLATAAADPPRLTMNPIRWEDEGPGNAEGPERVSGYFRLNHAADAHMFYFFFEARESPETAPVVLWMTGGPGCSSELAVFFENGPWKLDANLSRTETPYGWDVTHNMIFVDQPVGTGFSYSSDDRDSCSDEQCVANDMVDFLSEFFKSRPLAGRPFFVTGESYAGHYVPAVASRVYHASRSGELDPPVNLQGLAIGNGLTNPSIQYGAYSDYALENGLIGQSLHDALKLLYPTCRLALDACDGLDLAVECLLALQWCQSTQFVPIMLVNAGLNVYDVRRKCDGPLCYREFEVLDTYLNQASVRRALGVGDRKWEACNMEVHAEMLADWGHSFDSLLPELLAAGVRVMIYSGDQDFICNWIGNKQWVDVLPWHGAASWAAAAEAPWTVGGVAAGTVKQAGELSFVRVYNAGHMVPMDAPRNALAMITAFSRGRPLADAPGARAPQRTAWALRRGLPDDRAAAEQ